jgi:hypothetical protein
MVLCARVLLPYAAGPAYLPRALCPSTTFQSGQMGSSLGWICGLVLILLSFAVLAAYHRMKSIAARSIPDMAITPATKWYRIVFLIAPLCGLWASGML